VGRGLGSGGGGGTGRVEDLTLPCRVVSGSEVVSGIVLAALAIRIPSGRGASLAVRSPC